MEMAGWTFVVIDLTEQSDDVRMVEVFHVGRFIEELFNLPLGEAVHWRQRRNLLVMRL